MLIGITTQDENKKKKMSAGISASRKSHDMKYYIQI